MWYVREVPVRSRRFSVASTVPFENRLETPLFRSYISAHAPSVRSATITLLDMLVEKFVRGFYEECRSDSKVMEVDNFHAELIYPSLLLCTLWGSHSQHESVMFRQLCSQAGRICLFGVESLLTLRKKRKT